MKLHELEPKIDPRRPLRFAGVAPHRVSVLPVREAVRRSGAAAAPDGNATVAEATDLVGIDRAIAALAVSPAVRYRTLAGWRHIVSELSSRTWLGTLRSRADALVHMFTGASTGVLVALWEQERDQLSAQLHVDVLTRWHELGAARRTAEHVSSAAGESSDGTSTATRQCGVALAATRTATNLLEQFDYLDRAFSSHTVLALSPRAELTFAPKSTAVSRTERAFLSRATWGSGVVWLPQRAALIGWATAGNGTHLFEISAADLATWIGGLDAGGSQPLRWQHWLVPVHARLAGQHPWSTLAADLTRLFALGQTQLAAETGVPRRGALRPGSFRRGGEITVPVTRFVVTAPESSRGVAPLDLATGHSPVGPWVEARFRSIWSAAHHRYLRVWTDAYDPTAERPAAEPVLVTVLP